MIKSLTGLGLVAMITCGAPGKPEVELPPIESELVAELVAQVPAEDGLVDVQYLTVQGDYLYVAATGGLFIYDVSDPQLPVLVGENTDSKVSKLAVEGDRVYTMEIGGGNQLRAFDVSDRSEPVVVETRTAITQIFGGLATHEGLLWHSVGSSPPSSIYRGDDLHLLCGAPDEERGAMEITIVDGLAFASTHFDDFAGDGLNGNGSFGLAIFELDASGSGCPAITPTELITSPTHFLNRSKYERGASSDIQAAYDPPSRSLFMTGEQRVRWFELSDAHRATEIVDLDLPEVVDVAIDASFGDGLVLGLANGHFLLVDAREDGELRFAGQVETPGNARTVAPAGDGRHFFVGDSKGGIAVIEYGGAP